MAARIKMRAVLGLTVAAMLAACSGGAEEGPSGEDTATPAPIPLEPESAAETAPETAPVEEALANRIPTRFQGVWDYVEGTCAPESDMRMEISAAEILFYESIGVVTGVEPEGEDVVVSLAMEGEGETWDQEIRLALVGQGEAQLLETSDGEKPRANDDYPSKRCPE